MDMKELAKIEASYNTLAVAVREHMSIFTDEGLLARIDELEAEDTITTQLAAVLYIQELLIVQPFFCKWVFG